MKQDPSLIDLVEQMRNPIYVGPSIGGGYSPPAWPISPIGWAGGYSQAAPVKDFTWTGSSTAGGTTVWRC